MARDRIEEVDIPRYLPIEKMRESSRASDRRGDQPPSWIWEGPVRGAPRFIPNAEYERRMREGDPVDALNTEAGLLDLMRMHLQRSAREKQKRFRDRIEGTDR